MNFLKSGIRSANQLRQLIPAAGSHQRHLPVNQVRQIYVLPPEFWQPSEAYKYVNYETRQYDEELRNPLNFNFMGIVGVPEGSVIVVERNGEYSETLNNGLRFLNPVFDEIVRVLPLREYHAIPFPFTARLKDDTSRQVDVTFRGYMSAKIVDPKLATYACKKHPLGELSDAVPDIVERELDGLTEHEIVADLNTTLRDKIMMAINEVAKDWGVKCTCLHFITEGQYYNTVHPSDTISMIEALKEAAHSLSKARRSFKEKMQEKRREDAEAAVKDAKEALSMAPRLFYQLRRKWFPRVRSQYVETFFAELGTWVIESCNHLLKAVVLVTECVPDRQAEAEAKAEALDLVAKSFYQFGKGLQVITRDKYFYVDGFLQHHLKFATQPKVVEEEVAEVSKLIDGFFESRKRWYYY